MALLHLIITRLRPDDERGASLVEYALLVALIAMTCVAALTALGPEVSQPYSNIASGLE